ncbi:MAG: acetyltransferase [Mogibacterium sp.]|nr:acetyltransferase [Mogibacterium sp.]
MRAKYSLSEALDNACSLCITKIAMKQARLIRRPVYIRGRKSLSGCKGLTTGRFCRFDLEGEKSTLHIGDRCEMGDMTHIVAYERVSIGDDVLIASKCFISDTNHGSYSSDKQSSPDTKPNDRALYTKPVVIGDRVWIGENAVILAGSKIGNGCIIGANSVVSGEFRDNTIIAGSPAKVIKEWDAAVNSWIRVK